MTRGALYQEIAIAHLQVINNKIVRSDIEKQRHFLRCISPGEMSSYPKYKRYTVDVPKTPSGGGVRG